ncbi:toll/interleukin-1 receptor domain-containing protein [Streptomyces pseudovenezuelae]|uniref:toll/interleukin-1 receptor domain-containing protein n=1 Tax=Streptomyces pseudovenezuelae TaxID=67350 RepID=UPI00382B43B6
MVVCPWAGRGAAGGRPPSPAHRMSAPLLPADETDDKGHPSGSSFGERGLVFLSHSSRIRTERELGENDSLRDHQHRKNYLINLLTTLDTGLPRLGFQAWLDKKNLEEGEGIDTLIYDALARCRAAVILIDRDALDSSYVLAEATILNFRRTVGDPIHILPVLLGDVTDNDVNASKLGRILRLDSLLPLRPTAGKTDDTSVEPTADEIAQALDRSVTRCDTADSPTQRWIDNVSSYLAGASEDALLRAAKAIGVDPDLWLTTRRKPRALAAAFLSCGPRPVYRALQELVPQLEPHRVQRAVAHVQPLWVELDAAQAVMAATSLSAPDHVVGLPTRAIRLGVTLAERATMGDFQYPVRSIPEITGEDPINELVTRCDHSLRDELNLSHHYTREQLTAQLDDLKGAFVVLRCDGVDPATARAVMDGLRRIYRGIVIVALAPTGHRLWQAGNVKPAYESFTQAKEDAARKYVSDTAQLANDLIEVDSDD